MLKAAEPLAWYGKRRIDETFALRLFRLGAPETKNIVPAHRLRANFAGGGTRTILRHRLHANNWEELGQTDGWGRRRRDYYAQYDQPKQLFVRALEPNARRSLDATGRRIELPNRREYLLAKPSLQDRLESLRAELTPDEVHRSIWLIQNRPAELGMDICFDGRQVGSPITGVLTKKPFRIARNGVIQPSVGGP